MKTIRINAGEDTSQIYHETFERIIPLKKSFDYRVDDDTLIFDIIEDEDFYLEFIAGVLASYIVKNVEPVIIKEEVEVECFEFEDDEMEDIFEKVEWEVLYKSKELADKHLDDVRDEILEDLTKYNTFSIIGYLNFRFKMRRLEIKDYIRKAANEAYDYDGSEQFIEILKDFMLLKRTKTDLIHIVLSDIKTYEMYSSDFQRIDTDEMEELINNLGLPKVENKEEFHMIMTILMTMIPHEIVIHTHDTIDPFIPETLKRIFAGRTEICHSCEFCESKKDS